MRRPGRGDLPLPQPTNARPGSMEKMQVLQARLERGEALHHPEDERLSEHHVPYTRKALVA